MTPIYCFTGTGNSLFVARRLAEALGGEVLSMARAMREAALPMSDRAVLVYPTYMYRPPRLVAAFFRKLEPGTSAVAVVTHGGDPGSALFRAKALLKERGVSLRAGHGVSMPGNYTPFGGPGAKEEVERLLGEAGKRVDAIAAGIAAGEAHFDPPSGSAFRRLVYPELWYRLGYWAIPMTDQKFWVGERCDGCGTCARVCPVGNVEMADKRPRWNKKCEQCLACLQWCPRGAVELGKSTSGVDRYQNPEVSRRDLIDFQGRA